MKNIREYINSLGADLVGFADLTVLREDTRFGYPRGIAVAIAHNPLIVKRIPVEPTMDYFNAYNDFNNRLNEMVTEIARYITDRGFAALAQTTDLAKKQGEANKTADRPPRVNMPHKTVAALSGLGWIAKSTLLITEKYGSAVRLSSVLTDAPLPAEKAEYTCQCRDCRICVDACPASVIKNKTWTVETDRDDMIDFYTCNKFVVERGKPLGIKNAACGICMAVCPHTQRFVETDKK
jgi:epoxyqueuosine reductase QueG